MAKVITVFATKGGVGKSCVAGNLAGCLADMDQRVLMVDTDPQQTLTFFYPADPENIADKTLGDLITTQDPHTDCITKTSIPNLDLIIIDDNAKALGNWIRQSATRATALKVALTDIRQRYDYIIIDTEGRDGSGDLQELAVRAADVILIPINPDAVVAREFHRALHTLNRMRPLDPNDTYNQLPLPHVLIYRYDIRSRSHKAYVQGLRREMEQLKIDGHVIPLVTQIPQVVAYNDAQSRDPKQPVHRIDYKRRPDQTIPTAYESQLALVQELLPELHGLRPRVKDSAIWPSNSASSQNTATLSAGETHNVVQT